jgi:hypothetical protein
MRTTDKDVYTNQESARQAARRLGCIGIRRYQTDTGGVAWMPCTNESDYRKYSGIGLSGERHRQDILQRDIETISKRTKYGKKSAAGNYTNPSLRNQIKNRIMAGSKGGRPGQWSARKAQLLAMEYRRRGGGYKGKKSSSQRSLSKWTRQEWTTSDGKPAIQGNKTRRYLPKKVWQKLTPEQRRATNAKKIAGSKRGEQFVPNTAVARRARRRLGQKSARYIESSRIFVKRVAFIELD